MTFYIRKAFRLGLLRINLSRSGLGLSAGVKGLRIGSGPRGSYVTGGRGGLYFRHNLGIPSPRLRTLITVAALGLLLFIVLRLVIAIPK